MQLLKPLQAAQLIVAAYPWSMFVLALRMLLDQGDESKAGIRASPPGHLTTPNFLPSPNSLILQMDVPLPPGDSASLQMPSSI